MVKGISRRVIVVESPDPRVFDQAIFILRNDVLGEDGVSSRQLVDQAVRIAKSYPYPGPASPETPPSVPDHCRHFGRRAHGPCMAGGGAFVEAAEKPGKDFRWADNLLFSSFFLLTYGRPGVARLFCFSAGEFCGILG